MNLIDILHPKACLPPAEAPCVRRVSPLTIQEARQRAQIASRLAQHYIQARSAVDEAIDAAAQPHSTVGSKALARARELLKVGPVTVREVREVLGLSTSHAKRILQTLQDLGEIEHDGMLARAHVFRLVERSNEA